MDVVRDFLHRLTLAKRIHWLPSSPATWQTFDSLATQDRGIRGNLVADTLLAALAMAHGCRLATADRGFAWFRGLSFFDPAT